MARRRGKRDRSTAVIKVSKAKDSREQFDDDENRRPQTQAQHPLL
jgi:hypothetical protein